VSGPHARWRRLGAQLPVGSRVTPKREQHEVVMLIAAFITELQSCFWDHWHIYCGSTVAQHYPQPSDVGFGCCLQFTQGVRGGTRRRVAASGVPPRSRHRRSLADGIFEDFDHLGIEQLGNL
jgi:hypothetical protein